MVCVWWEYRGLGARNWFVGPVVVLVVRMRYHSRLASVMVLALRNSKGILYRATISTTLVFFAEWSSCALTRLRTHSLGRVRSQIISSKYTRQALHGLQTSECIYSRPVVDSQTSDMQPSDHPWTTHRALSTTRYVASYVASPQGILILITHNISSSMHCGQK